MTQNSDYQTKLYEEELNKENKEEEMEKIIKQKEQIQKMEENQEALMSTIKRAEKTIKQLEKNEKREKKEVIAVGNSNLKRVHPEIHKHLKETHNVKLEVAYTTDEVNTWIERQTEESLANK